MVNLIIVQFELDFVVAKPANIIYRALPSSGGLQSQIKHGKHATTIFCPDRAESAKCGGTIVRS